MESISKFEFLLEYSAHFGGLAYSYFFGEAMQDFAKLAAQIRGARALLGWSQAYLAEAINVRLAAIAAEAVCAERLRRGEKTPTQKVLPARAWHMRTDFSWRA
jgi:hypothetical protein